MVHFHHWEMRYAVTTKWLKPELLMWEHLMWSKNQNLASQYHHIYYHNTIKPTQQVMNLSPTLCVLHRKFHKIHFNKIYQKTNANAIHTMSAISPRNEDRISVAISDVSHFSKRCVHKHPIQDICLLWCHTGHWHLSQDNSRSQL